MKVMPCVPVVHVTFFVHHATLKLSWSPLPRCQAYSLRILAFNRALQTESHAAGVLVVFEVAG